MGKFRVVFWIGFTLASAATLVAQERPAHSNRLIHESSPYLLLHAHNPVEWYAWGPEALDRARREQKPIFLSIGYSSCHWCHVMNREVFENEDIAKFMNEHFVNIKVDREERPELDEIYMLALQVYFQLAQSNQGGGWPLSIFLTPDGKPIAGGTYFPPEDRPGMPGFPSVLKSINTVWTTRQADVLKTADILAAEVDRLSRPQLLIEDTSLNIQLVEEVIAAIKQQHDPEYGGLDFDADHPDTAKFPVPSRIELMQSAAGRTPEAQSLQMVDLMLDQMAAGGIYDHLGGGFHRYSTDREWHVPHFEKMLYDNAQLAIAYLEAYRRTNRAAYREVAEQTLQFLSRDMSDASGLFYSAFDADTNEVEGAYYVWSPAEVEQLLGDKSAALFRKAYGMEQPQTFEGGFVLHRVLAIDKLADDLKMPIADVERQLRQSREILLQARQKRPTPFLDKKAIAAWNGLAIQAYARAGQVLKNEAYLKRAEQGALAVLASMRDTDGRLRHSAMEGKSTLNAYLDDYAFVVAGLLALHEATGDEKWLNSARRLTDEQIHLFWDKQSGGFYFTTNDHETLIARTKSAYDSALPSGNSISARNLVRLAILTRETTYREHAEQTLRTFVPQMHRAPGGMAQLAVGIAEYLAAFGSPTQLAGGPPVKPMPQAPTPGSPMPPAAGGDDKPVIAAQATAEEAGKHEQVRAVAFLEHAGVAAGGETRLAVLVDIQPDWHINANPAQPDYVIPTTLQATVSGGGKLESVNYPKGHEFKVEGFDVALSVYEKRIMLTGKLIIPGETPPGEQELKVTLKYQACNDKNCLRPVTLTLTGKLTVLPAGSSPAAINRPLFAIPATPE